MAREVKRTAAALSFKAAEGSREATAVFATFDTGPDLDGDVYAPGAFTDGEPVIVSEWGHSAMMSGLPVGKGTIRTYGDRAEAALTFFSTTRGIDAHRTLRELGDAEFSFGYDVLDSEPSTYDGKRVRLLKKLKVYEVSPVWRGAGNDTRLVSLSGPKTAEQRELERLKLAFLRGERRRLMADLLGPIRERVMR